MTERKPSNTVVFHNINEVYAYVGDGVYQILIVTVCCLATFSIGIQELILYFLAFDPGWRCTETSSSCPYNRTIHNSDALYKSRCDMNRSDWTYAASNKFSIVTEVRKVTIFSLMTINEILIPYLDFLETVLHIDFQMSKIKNIIRSILA